jgi:protein TonB
MIYKINCVNLHQKNKSQLIPTLKHTIMERKEHKGWHWTSIMLVILLPVLAIVLIVDPDNLFHEGEKSTDAATNEQPTMTLTNVDASETENIDNDDAATDVMPEESAESEEDGREEKVTRTSDADTKTEKRNADIPDFAVAVKSLEGHDSETRESKLAKPDDKVYDVVEQMPSFPGGPAALLQYLNNNIRYPKVAEANGIQGRVTVQFVVEKDGSISGVKTMKSAEPSLDHEAERIVRSMPKWNPGKSNGSPVRVKYFVPVVFRLH